MSFHNTTDNEFWYKLAQESQEQFKQSGTHGKCCEAREFIIGLPQRLCWKAEWIADWFKGNLWGRNVLVPYTTRKKKTIYTHI